MEIDGLWSVARPVGIGLAMIGIAWIVLAMGKVILFLVCPSLFPSITRSCLYYGRVRHTRLKGGAVHRLDYPIFFAYLDLQEVQDIGWSFWPIFASNQPYITFCSFDHRHHLKDVRHASPSTTTTLPFLDVVRTFVSRTSGGKLNHRHYHDVQILTHLTYFGYCFNPISIYYLKGTDDPHKTVAVIAEVSNTPWMEMHSYLLHQNIPGVESYQYTEAVGSTGTTVGKVDAVWKKEFHVSPFMEMDYQYAFTFHEPSERVVVTSRMLKISTQEVWFTASFELQRIAFTPLNLLYVLIFYPLQTRLIQVYIHYEAFLIFWKGVPTFDHPKGTDVDFGLGITGARIGAVLWFLIAPFYYIFSFVSSPRTNCRETDKKTKQK
jgi:hypothetical protein